MSHYTVGLSPSAPTKRRCDIGDGSIAPSPTNDQRLQVRYDVRRDRLQALGFASYGDYLKSDQWRRFRERYRATSLPQDCICGDDETHLHHLTYDRVGREKLSDVTPLCRRCHALVHALERRGDIGLDLEGLVLDEERAAHGRALLVQVAEQVRQEQAEHLARQQEEILRLSFAARLVKAKRHAKAHRRDVTRPVWMLKSMVSTSRSDEVLTRQLRVIESVAYGWDDWRI